MKALHDLKASSGFGALRAAPNSKRQTKELSRAMPVINNRPATTLEERLYDALASFKVRTATVAMHIDREWRSRLFSQLDSLLSAQDWERDDLPPTLASFSTFLRMLIFLKPDRRPGLGASSDGKLIATWSSEGDHLTIECLPNDLVRWHLSVLIDDDRERAAAVGPVQRLGAVLAPYAPGRWFNAKHLPSA
jgi:hypothetical protein